MGIQTLVLRGGNLVYDCTYCGRSVLARVWHECPALTTIRRQEDESRDPHKDEALPACDERGREKQ